MNGDKIKVYAKLISQSRIDFNLGYEQSDYFSTTSGIQSFMEFAAIVAVGGVVAEDVAVASAKLFVEGGFVDCAGADVIGKGCCQHRVFAEMGIHGAEFGEVFAQERIGFSLCQGSVSREVLARPDSMTIPGVRKMAKLV